MFFRLAHLWFYRFNPLCISLNTKKLSCLVANHHHRFFSPWWSCCLIIVIVIFMLDDFSKNNNTKRTRIDFDHNFLLLLLFIIILLYAHWSLISVTTTFLWVNYIITILSIEVYSHKFFRFYRFMYAVILNWI